MENFLGFMTVQCLNALSQASLLFLIAVGLTLIFGIMRVINFAHGTIYMLGAYVGYKVVSLTGSFWLALIISPLIVAGVGALFERFFIKWLYGRDGGAFLMVTFGLAVILGEVVRLTFGTSPLGIPTPEILRGIIFVFDFGFPHYRLFLISIGILVAIGLWQFLDRTRIGLLIRATAQNPEMVHALGTNVAMVRTSVFALGCGLAALGGVLAAPLVTAFLGMGSSVIIDAFVIVIIGGMGSFLGSIIGSLLVAFVQVFGSYYFPSLALSAMYALMLIVLIIRPGGLLGKED
jgi:branched-chain amino acid transport system permease protein